MQSLTYNENTKYYGSYFNGVWKNVLYYDAEEPNIIAEWTFSEGSSSTTQKTTTYNVERNGLYCFLKGGANSESMMSISANGTLIFSNNVYSVYRMSAGSQVSFTNGQTGDYKYGGAVIYLGTEGTTVTNINSGISNSSVNLTGNATNADSVLICFANMAPNSAPGAQISVSGTSAGGVLSKKELAPNNVCCAYRQNPFNGAVTMTSSFGSGYHKSTAFCNFTLS